MIPVIPASWTNNDRRLYLKIAKRKKDEHVSAYTTISIGCQLFFGLARKTHNQSSSALLGEDTGEEDDNVQSCDSAAGGLAPTRC